MFDEDIEQEVKDWEETQTHADIDEGNVAAAHVEWIFEYVCVDMLYTCTGVLCCIAV